LIPQDSTGPQTRQNLNRNHPHANSQVTPDHQHSHAAFKEHHSRPKQNLAANRRCQLTTRLAVCARHLDSPVF
jgi:hypothetical protein